jgi:transposase
VFLVESGFALQADVARAFGCSVRTVRRNQRRYAQGGMAALGHETGWRRGRRRISAKRLRRIEQMKSQGMSNRAIAHKLGVTEKAIRKLVGPTRGVASRQLALPEIPPPKKSRRRLRHRHRRLGAMTMMMTTQGESAVRAPRRRPRRQTMMSRCPRASIATRATEPWIGSSPISGC